MAALQKMRLWDTAVALVQALVTLEEMRVQLTMPLPLLVAISVETSVVRQGTVQAVVQLTAQAITWGLLRVLAQGPAHAMAAFPTL